MQHEIVGKLLNKQNPDQGLGDPWSDVEKD